MAISTFFAAFLSISAAKAPQRGVLRRLRDWQDYRHLMRLDDHLLRDIGLTRDQVQAACRL